jgi:hypothetical protein
MLSADTDKLCLMLADTLRHDNGARAVASYATFYLKSSLAQLPSPFNLTACTTFTATCGSLNIVFRFTTLVQRF